jgi:transposase
MEVGADVSRFQNASAFAFWLGRCLDKRVSGGKVLYIKTRKVKNRLPWNCRWARITSTMPRIISGEFYRKMKWRLGAPEPVTATAHKLARIVYRLLSTREPYSESVLAKCAQLAYASRTTAA